MTEITKLPGRNVKACLILMYFFIGITFMFQMPSGISFKLITDYCTVLFSYFIVTGMWLYYVLKRGYFLFEPAVMVLLLTIISFSIEPMLSIITDNVNILGFYVFDGCKKATIIYMIAVIAFMFVYYNKFTFGDRLDDKAARAKLSFEDDYSNFKFYSGALNPVVHEQLVFDEKIIVTLSYFFACIGVVVSFVDLMMQGYSAFYILSLGIAGISQSESDADSLGVFINLRYLMIPSFLYLDEFAKHKLPVWLLRIVALACLFIRNKRWLIVIMILSPITYYYTEKMKKPDMKLIGAVAAAGVVVISAMQFMRYEAATSISEVTWKNFTLMEIWKGFSGNFDLYKTLYGAVEYFPEKHPHTMGQQMIFLTLVTCIPRAVWPSKPSSIFETLKAEWLGEGAVRGSWAYAQLTEFYVEFGVIGTIICMVIFAQFCKWLKKLYVSKRAVHDLVAYSFMFPMLMQLVIRGYMPINFWAVFFMWLPIWIIKFCLKIKFKKN